MPRETLAGLPAVTRHAYGAGLAWYQSTLLADDALSALLLAAAAAADLRPALPGTPPGIEVTRRRDGSGRSWLFAFNHGDRAAALPAAGLDLLTGREITGTLDLPPGASAVIREPPSALGGTQPGPGVRSLGRVAGGSGPPRACALVPVMRRRLPVHGSHDRERSCGS